MLGHFYVLLGCAGGAPAGGAGHLASGARACVAGAGCPMRQSRPLSPQQRRFLEVLERAVGKGYGVYGMDWVTDVVDWFPSWTATTGSGPTERCSGRPALQPLVCASDAPCLCGQPRTPMAAAQPRPSGRPGSRLRGQRGYPYASRGGSRSGGCRGGRLGPCPRCARHLVQTRKEEARLPWPVVWAMSSGRGSGEVHARPQDLNLSQGHNQGLRLSLSESAKARRPAGRPPPVARSARYLPQRRTCTRPVGGPIARWPSRQHLARARTAGLGQISFLDTSDPPAVAKRACRHARTLAEVIAVAGCTHVPVHKPPSPLIDLSERADVPTSYLSLMRLLVVLPSPAVARPPPVRYPETQHADAPGPAS